MIVGTAVILFTAILLLVLWAREHSERVNESIRANEAEALAFARLSSEKKLNRIRHIILEEDEC